MPARSPLTLVVCASFALLAACSGGQREAERRAAAQQTERQWLGKTRQQLEAKRQELVGLHQRVAIAAEEPLTVPAGETPAPGSRAELAARAAALDAEIGALSEEMGRRLVAYIDSFETAEGDPMPAEQQRAIRMKSDEDIEVAREWIVKGGDYRRAIEIYETQLLFDPDYARLRRALETAREMRYMTAERF
jgi:hypothetical protein